MKRTRVRARKFKAVMRLGPLDMVTREDELDEEVLEVLRLQPERNPDGTLWKLKIGSRFLTKREILENWDKDKGLRGDLRQLLLGLKFYRARTPG